MKTKINSDYKQKSLKVRPNLSPLLTNKPALIITSLLIYCFLYFDVIQFVQKRSSQENSSRSFVRLSPSKSVHALKVMGKMCFHELF